jgi:hypothetical protein
MKTIQVTIEDLEEKILQNELLDIQKWVQDAVDGKINNVKKRLLKEAQEKLLADPDVESIPATVEGMLELYFSRPYYKNREQRESEQGLAQV